jgi:autoinducer 2-degrading protein
MTAESSANSLLVVHVHCHVRREYLGAFREATLANARASVQEPGIARFDIIEDRADPSHVVLLEVYRDAEAPAAHKNTAHYQTWRDTVEPMMAEPRSSRKYLNVFPNASGW